MSMEAFLGMLGAGEEWKGMPWKVWTPPGEVWKSMPTFVMAEWGYRASMLVALYHAWRTGRKKSWTAAWVCGTANDIFFMFMPFCDNFWQAQGSVMITPRLPLYIVEMYACVMYYAPVAASLLSRSAGLNPVAQACVTGLLAHLYYGVYDVNGPRYLWWTWHDGDPAISERQANAPLGSSLWILTYCSLQSFLNSWILRAKGARRLGAVAPTDFDLSATTAITAILAKLPGAAKGLAEGPGLKAAGMLDRLQVALGKSSDLTQILFRALVCTPLFMTLMGILQVLSLDKLGIPGQRTYRLTLALMAAVVGHQLIKGRSRGAAPPLPESYRGPNRVFMAAVLAHFALHTLVNWLGRPERHASTGIHETVVSKPPVVHDIMGWEREEELPPTGPHIFSKNDYSFKPEAGVDPPVDAIVPTTEGLDSMWYTVYGRHHADRGFELTTGCVLAALGTAAFSVAMRKEL
eukprot:Hpha_TRINITY_DN8877_c0_g1::TRINITY_DN8877_c0_g1_i1::g.141412::m.141412